MKRFNAGMWSFPQPPNRLITTDELYELIIRYIEEGMLKPGQKLPAYRTIADKSKLPRTSVSRVYERLVKNDWVTAQLGSGTYVAFNFPNYELLYPATRAIKSLPLPLRIPPKSNLEKEWDTLDFTTIGFDTPGPYYCIHLLNYINWKKYEGIYKNLDKAARVKAIQGVAYKEAILEYLNSKRDFMINADSLDVVVGRNESLKKIFNVLLRAGDIVVNTSPKDKYLCRILNSYEDLEIWNIRLDECFLENLKKLLAHKTIKVLHIRPQCSHLENNTLSSDICTELLLLAKQHGFYIVEEDDYHEFWYETKPFKPLICQNHNGYVIYCGAFSLISTYLRQTRTIVAAEEFINLLKLNPIAINPLRDVLMEMAAVDLLNNNKLWLLIKKMQQDMKENWFGAWMQIDNTLSKFVTVKRPSSGLSFWLECPSDEWLKRSILYLEKMGFQIPYCPSSLKPGAGVQKIHLGFGTWSALESEEPLKALFAKYSI
jgi:GntR family transcriptional regulator/MocR family aminotransferase